jgi:small GTP-binding protein
MDLRDYEAAKFELADVLRDLAATLPADQDATHRRFDELFACLAEDRFNLVVVGRFNRGKTTLMNALLGIDRLPTGILPLTSVITRVFYGSTERVQIEFESGGFGLDIPMEALADYITEKGNPGNTRRIRQARIALPAELLRRGFHLIDTPGLGSAIEENTRTTETFFSEADAVLCVTACDAPLTEEEVRALRTFALSRVPTLVVVNKHDTLAPAAREEVLTYVRERLAAIYAHDAPQVYSVSATEGLAARLANDAGAAAASGIPALEAELTRFSTHEKGKIFIAGIHGRAMALLDELRPSQYNAMRSRLERLWDRCGHNNAQTLFVSTHGSRPAPLNRASPRITSCAICERVGAALFDFLCGYQHDLVVNPEARAALATTGLCRSHLWLYASMARDRDICLALTPLMNRVTETLTELQRDSSDLSADLPDRIPDSVLGGSCPVCRLQHEIESSALQEIARYYSSGVASHSPEGPPTVCLPHLRRLTRRGSDSSPGADRDNLVRALLERLIPAADRLIEDMQRYVLKRDAIRHGLTNDEESQAAKRALGFLAGSRAFPPQP